MPRSPFVNGLAAHGPVVADESAATAALPAVVIRTGRYQLDAVIAPQEPCTHSPRLTAGVLIFERRGTLGEQAASTCGIRRALGRVPPPPADRILCPQLRIH